MAVAVKEIDEENGLYYMRARYYSPEIGRFISKDPIGLAGGINMYAYVGNNPLNRIDPNGLWGTVVVFGKPWIYVRPLPRGIPEAPWWKWSEYNLPPHLYPKPKVPTHWWQKPWWPFNWKPEPPHVHPPEDCEDRLRQWIT